MPLADATAISFLNPIVTMALAIPLLVELVGLVRRMAVRISLIGAVILIRPVTDAFQPAALLALGSVLIMGCKIIYIKILSHRKPSVWILFINNGFGAIISLTAASFVRIMQAQHVFITSPIGLHYGDCTKLVYSRHAKC